MAENHHVFSPSYFHSCFFVRTSVLSIVSDYTRKADANLHANQRKTRGLILELTHTLFPWLSKQFIQLSSGGKYQTKARMFIPLSSDTLPSKMKKTQIFCPETHDVHLCQTCRQSETMYFLGKCSEISGGFSFFITQCYFKGYALF